MECYFLRFAFFLLFVFSLFRYSISVLGLFVLLLIAVCFVWGFVRRARVLLALLLVLFLLFFLLHSGSGDGVRHLSCYERMVFWVEGVVKEIVAGKKGKRSKLLLAVGRVQLLAGGERSVVGQVLLFGDMQQLKRYEQGSLLRVQGELRSVASGGRDRGSFLLFIAKPEQITCCATAGCFKRFLFSVRRRVVKGFAKLHCSARWLLPALLLGNKRGVPADKKRLFVRAGVAHLLAVSGMHVGMVVVLLLFICKIFHLSRWWQAIFLFGVLVVYSGLVGFSPSVMRASLMAIYWAVGKACWRAPSAWEAFFFAGSCQLMLQPDVVVEPAFLFSFAAVFFILLLYRRLRSFFVRLRMPSCVASLLAVSLAAQLGVFPLQLYFFGAITPFSIIASLFAVPLAFVLLLSAFAVLLADCVGLLFFVEPCVALLSDFFLIIVRLIASLPFSHIKNVPFSLSWLFLYYLLLILITKGWFLFGKKSDNSRIALSKEIAALFARK